MRSCKPGPTWGVNVPDEPTAAVGARRRFHEPLTVLPGIGPGSAQKLARLGLATVGDLILHLPFRYEDRTRSVPFDELAPGQECLVTGQVLEAQLAYGRRRSLTAHIGDGRGTLTARFFHFAPSQRQALRPGLWMRCFGEVRSGPMGLEMVHPEYRLHKEEPPPVAPQLTPVYRATQGLKSARIRAWAPLALEHCQELHSATLDGCEFPLLLDAIRYLHAPDAAGERLRAARERVVLDELLGHYLALKQRRAAMKADQTMALPPQRQLGRALLKQLGFQLTRAQAKVTAEVLGDLSSSQPMMRLLQGDVGSGKTVVAAFAAIRAAEHGHQTVVMAPTEILAEQHFETLSAWLPPLGIGIGLVTGRQGAAERRARLAALREGEDLVAVGTHALFQSGVEFRNLALAIIDEQHRFGVHQRMLLRDKGRLPHQLVMTATPIPRTLTMALYADMDVSTIDEMPPGRLPATTRIAAMARRGEVMARVARMCASGRQAYWVCTLIEDDDADDGRPPRNSAEATFEELRRDMGGGLRFGLVHGRLPPAEKSAAMAAFKAGEIDVLVATTVIEVGVDVPNATVMVIDNAEGLGLAQLHQLRGRIGRGGNRSECILLFSPPLSAVAKQRLAIIRETTDGFRIAEKDLELRGPGDMLGTRQTGEQTFRMVDLAADRALLPEAVRLGDKLLAENPPAAAEIVDLWAPARADYATV